jgi:wobble nucleotide-excising tRNase
MPNENENNSNVNEVTQRLLEELKQRDERLRILEEEKSQISNKDQEEKDQEKIYDVDKAVKEKLSDDSDDRYETLTNKQIIDIISSTTEKALEAQAKALSSNILKNLEPSQKKLQDMEKLTARIIASMGINEARSKYGDFDSHREAIGSVLQKYPNMSFDEAYLLAKSKEAGKVPPKSELETERPSMGVSLPTQAQTKDRDGYDKGGTTSGIGSFRNLMDEALDRIVK